MTRIPLLLMTQETPGRDARTLRLHAGPAEDWGTFCPESEAAFVGDGILDWLCPGCGAVLVMGSLHPEQFLDLLFRCYACGTVGGSLLRQPGRPLAGRPLLSPPGAYRLGSSVDLAGKVVMCVGQQAVDGYVAETGAGQRSGRGEAGAPAELSAASLRRLASECVQLLGTEHARLKASDERGRSTPTPPKHRNRLIELIEYAEQAARLLDQHGSEQHLELDGNLLGELVTTTALLRRWRNHPAWTRLVGTLASDTEGQHTVMLLGVASYLADAGNGVGIVADESDHRIPDIWIEPTLLERLEVEVKTPQKLRGPLSAPVSRADLKKLIERQLKAAASSKGGQISTEHSGIVAIGGYHLGRGVLDQLEDVGRDVLARQVHRKKHLAALVLTEMTYEIVTVVHESGEQVTGFTPILDSRLIKHPGYSGDLEIHDTEPPWQSGTPDAP